MVIIEDTRNQVGKHKEINAFLKSQGHTVIRSKMLVGDYQIANNGSVVIDTKKDVLELIQDIYQDHKRFKTECVTAQEAGIQLYVLIEEKLPNGRLDEWVSPVWKSSTKTHKAGQPISKANPSTLRKALYTMQERYGVKFLFCPKEKTGEIILKILSKSVDK